ncbi:transmembrane protein 135-like [Vespa mandarinia]|uniref:transmembrane protein 135-like n=1 Tax=Vespa mandarinia TaxID=7446 RepID=UPI0016138320|nr:transmembrane protein 135-like [Vespa mandarinia]XP_035731259.1 transmembrane protein 135-like [Vespa mandarinia]XP_035731260.1 transmembrane protein 135-like [Vespa mandarinia]
MPANFSKFIKTSCKECTHWWTNSCISASMGLGLDCLQESLKIYSIVYIITLLMKRKKPTKDIIIQTILGILQSSAFLSWTAFNYSLNICGLRKVLGCMNIITVSFLPSFLSNIAAILIEKPSRRTLLCLYVSNVATETLFNMGIWRGYYRSIPYGQVYIFALSISMLLYFYRSKPVKQDSIYKLIRFIIGPYEQTEYFGKRIENFQTTSSTQPSELRTFNLLERRSKRHTFDIIWKSFEVYKQIINNLKNKSKHLSCPHPYSCAHYILMSGAQLFSYGYGIQVAIQLIFHYRQIFTKSKNIKKILFKRKYFKFAVFLGGFTTLYKFTSCLLRRIYNKDSPKFAIPAGLVASIAFIAFPNNTLALYFMWKVLHLICIDGVEKGILPDVKWFVIFLYSFSTAVLFHAGIFEPQNLRTSYWKFLYKVSGGRIASISRLPLEPFGLNSYKSLQEVLARTNTTDKRIYSF